MIQIYVPAKMVYDSEVVLDEGISYKFKTAPVDPSDPFRGKYITLQYDIDEYKVVDENDWSRGEKIYVQLTTDKEGYAKILDVSKEKPHTSIDYVHASVDYVRNYSSPPTILINYPFTRFYMEESKAYDAELAYRRSQRDTAQTTYAVIHIKNGAPIIKDVFIDEVPIRELVKRTQNK